MEAMKLPPGFRFHPMDEELVGYYLKRKVGGRSIQLEVIAEVDLYKWEPWDLPEKSILSGSDMEWYFYSPRDKKYPNGQRTNRATEAGYWKATGKDRNVKRLGKVIGMKKTLVFYRGRAPHGERTDWVMHEYRLDEEECGKVNASQDMFVLCRVFKKSGVGPRSGEDRGPPSYVDEDDVLEKDASEFSKAIKNVKVDPVSETAAVQETAVTREPSSISVLDYPVVNGAHEVIESGGPTFDDFMLSGTALPQIEEEVQFWDCLSLPAAEFEIAYAEPFGVEAMGAGPPVNELDQVRRTGRQPAPEEDAWNGELASVFAQSAGMEGSVYLDLDMLEHESLDSDDRLPPLVEEQEPLNSGNRRLSYLNKPRRRHPFVEVQPSQVNGANVDDMAGNASQQMMSTYVDARRNMDPELQSQARMENNVETMTWGSAPEQSSSVQYTNLLTSPATDARAVIPVGSVGFGNSDMPLNENFAHFSEAYDSFLDFPEEEQSMQMPSEHNSFNFPTSSEGDLTMASDTVTTLGSQGTSRFEVPQSGAVISGAYGQRQNCLSYSDTSVEDWKPPTKPLVAGLLRMLGSVPALPASAAEYPPDLKSDNLLQKSPLQSEIAPTYNSIHVSAVTVTCTCSADGAQQVHTAVTDGYGDSQAVFQQVVSGSWQTIPYAKGASQQGFEKQGRPQSSIMAGVQKRAAKGSNSGFVFVFALGAVSAVCWFLAFQVSYRIVRHVINSVF